MALLDPLRHHKRLDVSHGAFGTDTFGVVAEKFARGFGTPQFIVIQTLIVALWIVLNILGLVHHWDKYPFILLNLCFSTQAAYAAPLILLAQTRQADRDKKSEEASAHHREELAQQQARQLQLNTDITTDIHGLQVQQMTILESVQNTHGDLERLTAALMAKGVIDGGPGADQAVDSGSGSS